MRLILALLLSLAVFPCFAGETVDPRFEAMARLQLDDPAGACRVLDESFPKDTKDIDVLYLQGRCRLARRDFTNAIPYYEAALQQRPGMTRAQVELGQAYAQTGQLDKARDLYRNALTANPPQNLTTRLQDALDILDQQKNWYARIEGGALFDSNINSGPQNDQVTVFDTPFTLASSAQKTDSFGVQFSGDVGYNARLSDNTTLVTQLSASQSRYFDNSDFDIATVQLGVGPAWRHGDFKTVLQPNILWQALGDDTYRTALGLSSRSAWTQSDDTEWGLSVLGQKNIYPIVTGRKSLAATISPDVTYRLARDTTINTGLILRLENADNDIFSNTGLGARFALTHDLYEDLKTTLFYQYLNADYDGRQPAFGNRARADDQHVAALRLDWDISPYSFSRTLLSAKYQYIDNNSNIDLYGFDRHILGLTVGKSF